MDLCLGGYHGGAMAAVFRFSMVPLYTRPLRRRCRPVLVASALAFSLAALTPPVARTELVRVAVASSFRPALAALALDFHAQTGHRLRLSAASSGVLAAQLLSGAPFDVFLSADTARPLVLERAGYAAPGSRFTYVLGRLALLGTATEPPWPTETMAVAARLAALPPRSLALPDPALAPIGAAAQDVLVELGLWRQLAPGLVRAPNAAHVLHLVYSGAAQAGFVALAQARLVPDAAHWPVPSRLHRPVVQQALLLRPATAGARDLGRFLRGAEVRRRLRQAGYQLPPAVAN